jgi:ferric-dicitrate binding protein FerR (iron transport regulator)
MPASSVVAGLVAVAHGCQRREIAAGDGTEFVNGAGHRFTDAPAQCNAAQWRCGGAAHANQPGAQRLDKSGRYAAAWLVIDFFDME